jgi:hypothetical protein
MWPTVKADLAAVWAWILAHWTSLSSIGAAWAAWWGMLIWFKSRKIHRCARSLRAYAQRMRQESPASIETFSIILLGKHLGKDRKILDDVIEYMEEKHWAEKVAYPPGHWKIN